MSWEEIVPKRVPIVKDVSVSKSDSHVTVFLSGELLKRLKWEQGTCFSVHRGIGDDTGRLRIKKNANGYKLRKEHQKTSTLRLIVRPWAGLPAEAKGIEEVTFKLNADGDGALELTLPRWGQAQAMRAKAA